MTYRSRRQGIHESRRGIEGVLNVDERGTAVAIPEGLMKGRQLVAYEPFPIYNFSLKRHQPGFESPANTHIFIQLVQEVERGVTLREFRYLSFLPVEQLDQVPFD